MGNAARSPGSWKSTNVSVNVHGIKDAHKARRLATNNWVMLQLRLSFDEEQLNPVLLRLCRFHRAQLPVSLDALAASSQSPHTGAGAFFLVVHR